jgi:hypothetical protein
MDKTFAFSHCSSNMLGGAGSFIWYGRSGVDVMTAVEAAIARVATPEHPRCDKALEFIAGRAQDRLEAQQTKTPDIMPGSPKLRDECLNHELYGNLRAAGFEVPYPVRRGPLKKEAYSRACLPKIFATVTCLLFL